MKLDFRIDKIEGTKYKQFYGELQEQMPKLIAEGRIPMNTSQLMQKQIYSKNDPLEMEGAWTKNHFSTGDAIIHHPNGDTKIVLDCQTLREITPESKIINGSLIIDEDTYKNLPGEVFTKENRVRKNYNFSKEEVKAHPVWRILARDQSLLNEYTDFIFAECKKKHGYNDAMPLFLFGNNDGLIEMRDLYLWNIRSALEASCVVLNYWCGHLIGIKPDTSNLLDKIDSTSKTNSVEEIQEKDETQVYQSIKPLSNKSINKTKSLLSKFNF